MTAIFKKNTSCSPVILIPAYKPKEVVLETVKTLIKSDLFSAIVCVDDGSGEKDTPIFKKLVDLGVIVLHHCVNLGKGSALKMGFNMIACDYPNTIGVITLDADGQHASEDIIKMGEFFAKNPNDFIMGCRSFGGSIPLRSRVGNIITRYIIKILLGTHTSDTQTGLRGIPFILLPHLLRISADGYDFEMAMLVECITQQISIKEVPIKTIYINNNESSHFRPLFDSFAIYFVLFRYCANAIGTAILDYIVFASMLALGHSIFVSIIAGRIIAGFFNFLISKNFVFKSKDKNWQEIIFYITLVAALMMLAYGAISILVAYGICSPLSAKILVEACIFFLSFAVQKVFIFKQTKWKIK